MEEACILATTQLYPPHVPENIAPDWPGKYVYPQLENATRLFEPGLKRYQTFPPPVGERGVQEVVK